MTRLFIAYSVSSGWCVLDEENKIVSGPYDKHEDAVAAIETIAFRIAQGWKP